ncbi:MAG: glycerol-3-phosphate 1-O-acyltransferase PlsY [Deltaproteobacteria bacterium]|nr:glycerol-3-phosphate 1-O-acyltransferase PlsY [Deltaproteobacteria bacterium]
MIVFAVVLAFWLGAIPFGMLVARKRGVDIREHGSGNIGASNVGRVLGARAGLLVLALDAGKGMLAVAVAQMYTDDPRLIAGAAFAAIVGHCFSPFLRGRGGKGVATAFGAFLVLVPKVALLAVAVFVVVWRIVKVPALGSLAASTAMAAALIAAGDRPLAVLASVTTGLLVYTHRSNLAKLANRA